MFFQGIFMCSRFFLFDIGKSTSPEICMPLMDMRDSCICVGVLHVGLISLPLLFPGHLVASFLLARGTLPWNLLMRLTFPSVQEPASESYKKYDKMINDVVEFRKKVRAYALNPNAGELPFIFWDLYIMLHHWVLIMERKLPSLIIITILLSLILWHSKSWGCSSVQGRKERTEKKICSSLWSLWQDSWAAEGVWNQCPGTCLPPAKYLCVLMFHCIKWYYTIISWNRCISCGVDEMRKVRSSACISSFWP